MGTHVEVALIHDHDEAIDLGEVDEDPPPGEACNDIASMAVVSLADRLGYDEPGSVPVAAVVRQVAARLSRDGALQARVRRLRMRIEDAAGRLAIGDVAGALRLLHEEDGPVPRPRTPVVGDLVQLVESRRLGGATQDDLRGELRPTFQGRVERIIAEVRHAPEDCGCHLEPRATGNGSPLSGCWRCDGLGAAYRRRIDVSQLEEVPRG